MTCSGLLVKNVEECPGTWLKLITKTLSKSLRRDAILWGTQILCRMLLMQNAQNRQQERFTLCLKSLRRSPKCRLRTSHCQKHWAKAIFFKLVIFSNFLNSTGKKLERQGLSMDIFPDDLEQVYNQNVLGDLILFIIWYNCYKLGDRFYFEMLRLWSIRSNLRVAQNGRFVINPVHPGGDTMVTKILDFRLFESLKNALCSTCCSPEFSLKKFAFRILFLECPPDITIRTFNSTGLSMV